MVKQSCKPRVLIIDDDDMESYAMALETIGVRALLVTPNELREAHLESVDIILIDEFLKVWPDRDKLQDLVGLQVWDGIALSSVLRSYIDGRGRDESVIERPSNTSVILRTGHLDSLASDSPKCLRSIVVAQQHDLEWVMRKDSDADWSGLNAVVTLANAVVALPRTWSGFSTAGIADWLDLGERTWRDVALAHVEDCRPPWSFSASSSAGRKWIAWFAQTILPFATFLVDELRAAAYFGLKRDALNLMLTDASRFGVLLRDCLYTGQMADFSGRRWWRAGLQSLREMLSACASDNSADGIADVLGNTLSFDISEFKLGMSYPVFQINEDFDMVPVPIEISQAVRLQPDGWPVYADVPWLALSLVDDSSNSLRRLIVSDDRI